ncbi:heavy metal-associated domain protein, partial [Ostertagia ostertagi]
MPNEYGADRCLLDDSLLAPRSSATTRPRGGSSPSPSSSSIEKLNNAVKGAPQTAVISINGMTCHACVNNIQDTMRTRPGIHSCKVSLDDAEGVVVFDPILWTGMSVAESIDDMGFEAKLKYTREGDEISVAANSATRKAIISIKGMNGVSCLREQHPGHNFEAGWSSFCGTFIFDPSIVTADELVEAVDDMGFETQLISC